MSFASFWSDLLATVFGGIALALIFFLAKEKCFSLPNLTGRWFLEQTTQTTAYAPYEGMVLRYVLMLWLEGNRVEGTAEKLYENSSTGEREYIGTNRTRSIVSGYVEKRYFGSDRIYLHCVEDGHGRESTNFFVFTPAAGDRLAGTFTSMVAEQTGVARCQRNPF
jgi:hypothetical protein